MSKRIFVAVKIYPEQELLEVVDQVKYELLGERIKWVDENQFHITLKFLGDTQEADILRIQERVRELCIKTPAFSFDVCTPSYFRNKKQLKAILLKISDLEKLKFFQARLEHEIAELGIPKEDRIFKPHLTLGRVKYIQDSRSFYEFVKSFHEETLQKVHVYEIILYESILKQTGPEYFVIEKFSLQ